jgi:sulfur-oxidizing protein SoxZ
MARVLLSIPRSARRGEIIPIRALIQHPMESGYRPGVDGEVVPRDIIRRLSCHYDGEVVFRAELSPAIAANPFVSFTTLATNSGLIELRWEGDNDFTQLESRAIAVT